MSFLGELWETDDYVTFACNTHDPDTGVATDADSAPTYRVYEDETGSAITNGTMAKLDDANTTGFYSEQIMLRPTIGYEAGKMYTIYISATVDSDTGTMHHCFRMNNAPEVNLADDAIGLDELDDYIITSDKIASSAITSSKIAENAITASKIATDAITSDELASSALNEIADAVLIRDFGSVVGAASRSALNALRYLRNKVSISGSTLTVTQEDDSTQAWTATVTTDATADPITAVDPD